MKYYIAQFRQDIEDHAEDILYSRYAVAMEEDKHLLSYLYAAGFCYFCEENGDVEDYEVVELKNCLDNRRPFFPAYEEDTFFDKVEEVSKELFELHTSGGSSLLRVKAVKVPEEFYKRVKKALSVEDKTDTSEENL